ncbi:MAG TPA: tRNA (adenosine(37)-N6)-threonylcarbamoyltransferase complex dimerization subunit type 1 TsaB [Gammaproteobacteria bacterium]|nr:tRNA (adenosine(37)-N6)-threonylcarbamoyltransferase complex dimerization subunit type 1 TsaB [Gammaproteobacteria bacterium]
MPKILSIDTSTEACSASLLIHNEMQVRFEICPRQHGVKILPMVDDLLSSAQIALHNLDAIAVSQGPGSFTGVRLGISVAQGLSFGSDLPLVPVSTLKALAFGAFHLASQADYIVAAMDAKMDEIYYAVYQTERQKTLKLVGEEQVIPPNFLPALPADFATKSIIGCGHGFKIYNETLCKRLGVPFVAKWPEALPNAENIGWLAKEAFLNHEIVSPQECMPVYLRNKVIQNI